jgi:hypothetical protein
VDSTPRAYRLKAGNAAPASSTSDGTCPADLLAHGLIRPSFVPEAGTQEMRALLRTRTQLVREQASHVRRMRKTLEDANLKLSSVLTNIMGKSGRAIIEALIAGKSKPEHLLCLVQRGKRQPITTGVASGLKFQGKSSSMRSMVWPRARRSMTAVM